MSERERLIRGYEAKNVWNVTGSSGFLSMIYEVDLDLQKDPRDALRQRSPPNGMRSHALKSQEFKILTVDSIKSGKLEKPSK